MRFPMPCLALSCLPSWSLIRQFWVSRAENTAPFYTFNNLRPGITHSILSSPIRFSFLQSPGVKETKQRKCIPLWQSHAMGWSAWGGLTSSSSCLDLLRDNTTTSPLRSPGGRLMWPHGWPQPVHRCIFLSIGSQPNVDTIYVCMCVPCRM